jgi:pimeloyl-ACP methyl ester carboxylesterase/membrane protein DedA with SNARE-associated domain
MPADRPHRKHRVLRTVAIVYVLLVAASWGARHARGREQEAPAEGAHAILLRAVDGERLLARTVRVAYTESRPPDRPDAPTVILVHGSPGEAEDFRRVMPGLADRYRVIAPDLPGFGASEHDVPDYSLRAHARYLLSLMDALRIHDAHVVGFSMGGGVVLSMEELAPRRIDSITMLSAIGVQEMELLGEYNLNHALHGLQLAGLWALRELTPQFGVLDRFPLGVPYARNFYDSDQRPLRGILSRYSGPMLVIHGEHDPLVPIAAAREHARLVPQAELVVTDKSHFMVFQEGPVVAATIHAFLDRVEAGTARTRAGAEPARIAASARPFDPADLPRITGFPWLVVLVLLAAATFVSEDLACIVAGLLVAAHRFGFVPAAAACTAGILIGDLGLFAVGRILGRAAIRRAPLKWLITEAQVRKSSAWFRERGAVVIFASRFLPGTRLPTYVGAGLLETPFWRFFLWFALAAIVWTPLLVGVSALLGAPFLALFFRFRLLALPAAIVTIVLVLLVVRLVPSLFTHRGRRLLAGRAKRVTRWEFWPPWAFYPPVVLWVLWLGIRHRGLTLFTAANPAIEGGGFIGESKTTILRGLAGAGSAVARWRLLPASLPFDERVAAVRRFLDEDRLGLPLVLKPDLGQRGSGVTIARDWDAIERHLRTSTEDTIAQEYVPGIEFGVFYIRHPDEARGRIFSITEKTIPSVVGDGSRTLERLILDDRRAVAMASIYFAKNEARLKQVVPKDERVPLSELGTHCRGAIFGDGTHLLTPELSAAIDTISRAFEGFFFGRYDVRSESVDAFRRGELTVIELNGVTSEATAIYDPRNGLLDAYRTLFAQWRLAFEIGAANRARGVPTVSPIGLARLIVRYRATAGERPDGVW